MWNFDNVPSTGEAAKTWPDDPNKIKAGGGIYSSFALDPDAGLVYAPVGNPGPDFVKDYRPGDNLYTCGVVVLKWTIERESWPASAPRNSPVWDCTAGVKA